MKTWKEIGIGALKVVGYAGATAMFTALATYLQDLTKTEQGITLVIINVILYVITQLKNLKK